MFKFNRKAYRNLSDEALVVSYKKDKDKAFVSILYERYAHLVLGACLKYLKNTEESKDMTMHIFESLFEKLKVHEVSNFKSWLYVVTRNECFMFIRKNQRSNSIDDSSLIDESEMEENQHLDIQIELLSSRLSDLKMNQKACIELFYIQNKSYNEISESLDISVKQVKSEIQNGKRNLKLLLEKENAFNQ